MSERLRQYAYLRITSKVVPPDEITRRIAIDPDQQWWMGQLTPTVKKDATFHHWRLDSGVEPGEDYHPHLAALARKLAAKEKDVRSLRDDCWISLQIVRYLEASADSGLNLSSEEIDFLARMGASLSVDDYGGEIAQK